MASSKIDAVFALRDQGRRGASAATKFDGRPQLPATGAASGIAKVDCVFATRANGVARHGKVEGLFGAPANRPASEQAATSETAEPQPASHGEGSPDIAKNDWTRMTDADVRATAAYAVSTFRDETKARALLVARAGEKAFRAALVPNGLQPGQNVSDFAQAAVDQAMAERGWA